MERSNAVYWIQRDGTEIAVKDMGNMHLANTFSMLIRNAGRIHFKEIINADAFYNTLNGDGAQLCMEREIEQLVDTDPIDFVMSKRVVRRIVREIKRRKIQSHLSREAYEVISGKRTDRGVIDRSEVDWSGGDDSDWG